MALVQSVFGADCSGEGELRFFRNRRTGRMDGNQAADQLQALIDRFNAGDEGARNELFTHAYDRFRALAARLLHVEFARLAKLHDTGSVTHEAVIRLMRALDSVKPKTVRDFLNFAAVQMRRVLIDVARSHDRRPTQEMPPSASSLGEPMQAIGGGTTDDPANLLAWTEFHERVDELPSDERDVVNLYWYQGLTQAEASVILDLPPKEVSRCWLRASRKLSKWIPRGGMSQPE